MHAGGVGTDSEAMRRVGSDRVLYVLAELARHPDGVGLEELARTVGSPKASAHRALAAIRRAGFATQNSRGRYLLGDEFIRLAFAHHEARPVFARVQPLLERLAEHFGETAHYAVLDGRDVVYRAKVDPSKGAVKLTSVVGGRNLAHSTAVGKMLLAHALETDGDVRAWVRETKRLERRTGNTIISGTRLAAELSGTRRRGYATEEEENEIGVVCVALPIFLDSPHRPSGAISVSALRYRMPLGQLVAGLPTVRRIIRSEGIATSTKARTSEGAP